MQQFVSSNVNVIPTLQTCGQCWSRATDSKRQALENYFPTKFQQKTNLATYQKNLKRVSRADRVVRRKNWNLALHSGFLFTSIKKVHDLDLSLPYILIRKHLANSLGKTISYSLAHDVHAIAQRSCQCGSEKSNASARRLLPADMLERCPGAGLPRQDHGVCITTDVLFRFHDDK